MPYNIAAVSFPTKKHCSRLSSIEIRSWRKNGRFEFLGSLSRTYGRWSS